MKTALKVFKFCLIIVTILSISLSIYACASVPKLSKTDKKTINAVMKSPLPELITGETGFVDSGSYRIWYERIRPKEPLKGSILLIMGLGNDALRWSPKLISCFVNHGYEVVRFDHRGTGLTTSTVKWKKKNAYTLSDMSEDVLAILSNLQLKKVHVIGSSMGGMIAQLVAIDHPEKTESLSLLMTTGDFSDKELPTMSKEFLPQMISAVLKHGIVGGKKGNTKLKVVQRKLLMGEAVGVLDVKEIAEISLYDQLKRDGHHLMTARHHQQAILSSGPRYRALRKMQVPTLVIHGLQDPLLPISHGQKLARNIPNVDSLWIDNMGHNLPDRAIPKICARILAHFEQ